MRAARRPALWALWLVLLAGSSPAAGSARVLHTVLEDDELALFSPASLPQFTSTLHWLGIDELRISAEWKLEAPDGDSSVRPRVDLSDPSSYDASSAMQGLDKAVRAASRAGIGVIIDPAFSAPLWASANPPPREPGGDPWFKRDVDVGELAQWEAMLARRYNGSYVPTGQSTPLPRVQTYTLWNEPNQQGFLAPQWHDGTPASADWYRALLRRAYPAIEAASPGATVLIGDTSGTGGGADVGNPGVPPLAFIRRLACVNTDLEPIRGGSCANFHELPGDGWSQHPYERYAPPWVPSGAMDPDGAQMGDLGHLQALLDKLVARHRFAPGVADLWLTEQGYESNGQIPQRPWSETQQADLNAISEYLAWRDPQVASFSQFLLRDSLTAETLALRTRTGNPDVALHGTWTTGLEREDGSPKPALAMFRSPVVARVLSGPDPLASWLASSPAGSPAELVEVWGRARPLTSPSLVQIQVDDSGTGAYRDAATAITDANGIFDVRIAVASEDAAAVRFSWLSANGSWQTSPAVMPIAVPVS